MGQSLGSGEEAFPVVTTADTGFENYQFRRGVHTWRPSEPDNCANPERRRGNDFALVPIIGGEQATHTGETIASGLVDSLKAARDRPADLHYLFSYAGVGNTRLRDLDKRHDDTTDPRALRPTPGGFYRTSIDDVRRGAAQAAMRGWQFEVGAITWMQGERNEDLRLNDWSEPLPREAFLEAYAEDLIALKNDWNDDIRAITQQSSRIHLFTYQTRGSTTGQAQLLAADTDPEIHLTSPTYYMMSAVNSLNPFSNQWGAIIHITGDSERWLGAQFAKVMKRTLLEQQPWQPLRPLAAWASADRTEVFIRYAVPVPPLVIENDFLPALAGAGLRIVGGPGIAAVAVASADTLALTLDSPLPSGTAFSVDYATVTSSAVALEFPAGARAVRAGRASNGEATYEVLIPGDVRDQLRRVLQNGVFYLQTASDFTCTSSCARGIIRNVTLDASGDTVLQGISSELEGGTSFVAGQSLAVALIWPYGNIRDSDNEPSLYTFATGPRAGQPYPLWNWSVAFEGLPIGPSPP
jgi:hypothetical protein